MQNLEKLAGRDLAGSKNKGFNLTRLNSKLILNDILYKYVQFHNGELKNNELLKIEKLFNEDYINSFLVPLKIELTSSDKPYKEINELHYLNSKKVGGNLVWNNNSKLRESYSKIPSVLAEKDLYKYYFTKFSEKLENCTILDFKALRVTKILSEKDIINFNIYQNIILNFILNLDS